MPTLQELREKRANTWSQAQDFNSRAAKGETMSAEDEGAWKRALDEVDSIGEQIETRERTETLDKRFADIDEHGPDLRGSGDPGGDAAKYRAAYNAWMRSGMTGISDEHRQMLAANARALQTDTGSAGGYTVPDGFWAKVTETMKLFGGVLQVAEPVNTTTGANLPWATNDDTANTGEILEEGSAVSEQDVTFGQKTLGAYTASSKMIRVSDLLLQDTGIDLEGFLARRAGERIGRIQNTRLTTGTGSSQPQGLITGATTGKTTAGATAITYLELIDLIHSVDAAYRQGECGFMMHDLILAYVRKIKDDSGGAGVGRPIWEPSVQAGVPDLLLGYKYTINNDMASTVATTNKTMAFGDFRSGYVVRKVSGGAMRRLTERYSEYLQTAFFGYERFDGLVQDSSAYKLLVQT
ncbi:MAG: phage major capsid protein [Microthrixaceae bacterium]|nr:phage major capsid protein [Microthrixaceae bacterium]